MRLLLDTHVFIWSFSNPKRLKVDVARELKSSLNDLFVSVASIWEIQIKLKLGKMKLDASLQTIVYEQENNGIQILNIDQRHALFIENLPLYHKDPFDRMLISQAMVEDMTIVTVDKRFSDYDVKVLW